MNEIHPVLARFYSGDYVMFIGHTGINGRSSFVFYHSISYTQGRSEFMAACPLSATCAHASR
jgi:hypothetical protein